MARRATLLLTVDGAPCHVPRKQRVSYAPENPKQRGSAAWERYQKYKGARTLEEAVQMGATVADFHFDLSRGFLRIRFLRRSGPAAASGAGAAGKLAARARRLLRRPAAGASAGRPAPRAAGPALLPVLRAFGDSPPRGVGAAGPPVLHVLSLGSRCLVARALSDLGLRRYAGPLDWVYSNTEMVRSCLEDSFAQFLEPRNLVASGSAWGHKVYGPMLGRGVVFPHHEPRTRDRVFFQRATSRFQQVMSASSERKLLVQAVPITKMESLVAQEGSAAGDAAFAEASQLFADLRGHGVRNFELLVVLLVAPGASVCSGRRPGVLPPRIAGCSTERLVLVELHCAGEQTGVNFRADEDERAFRALVRGPPGRQRRFQLQADPLPPRSGSRGAAGRAAPARRMALGEVREPPGMGGAKRRRR